MKSKSPSPIRSPDSPKMAGRRSYSPLKNIEVPPSNLLPVKEEAELSSQSDVSEAAKTTPPKEQELNGCKILNIWTSLLKNYSIFINPIYKK